MRQIKKPCFYHDYDAMFDFKVMKLRNKHGWEGYGLFQGLLETLGREGGELECDYESLSLFMNTKQELLKSVIEDFGLFIFEDRSDIRIFKSKRLCEHQESVNELIEKRKSAGKSSAENRKCKTEGKDNNQEHTHNMCSTHIQQVLNTCPTLVEQSQTNKENKINKEREKEKENNNLSSTTNCDSTENLKNIEGETENFGEMTVDVVDENIPLVNAEKQTSETVNDFYMIFKNDAAAIEQMCIFTHKDRTAIMNFLIEFEAQCKYDGKFDKSYNDFKNHFRNWVNKKVSVRTSMNGKTVTRHNPNLRPGQCEYIDSDGRRRCADTNALIPDDAPPRPGNGSRWISSTKKWIPAGI